MSDETSPRPWRLERGTVINEPDFKLESWDILVKNGQHDECVGEIYNEADAALIVRAVSMHDELVAALERLTVERPQYDTDGNARGFCFYCHELTCDPDCAFQQARALLTRAKEGA